MTATTVGVLLFGVATLVEAAAVLLLGFMPATATRQRTQIIAGVLGIVAVVLALAGFIVVIA